MASSARIDEIKKKFDENPRRYFAPLANEFRKAGDLEQAIVICEEFLPQQAGHMSGHIVYGQALYESGRLPESRTVFETALGLDPENLIALRHLGDIARSQGELADARRWYDRVLEADPRNDEIQGLIASLGEGGSAVAPSAAASPVSYAMPDDVVSSPMSASREAPALEAIDLDIDDAHFGAAQSVASPAATPPGLPVTPPPIPLPDAPFDAIPLHGLEPTNAESATSAGMPESAHPRADGFESSEFEAPAESHARTEGLEPAEFEAPMMPAARAEGLESTAHETPHVESTDDSLLDLESSFELGAGSAASRSASIIPVDGLEESGATQPRARGDAGLPSLDVDDGLALTPHGDALEHPTTASYGSTAESEEFDALRVEDPRMDPPAAMEAMPALAFDAPPEPAHAELVTDEAMTARDAASSMMELPPAVIAAESALMDVDDEFALPAADGTGDLPGGAREAAAGGAPAPFTTETMAELYLKQGFRDQALGVYRQLSAASPSDSRLRARVVELEQGEPAERITEAPAKSGGPTVREFFFRLANRRPNERAVSSAPPSNDDFASFEAVPSVPFPEPIAKPIPEPIRPSAQSVTRAVSGGETPAGGSPVASSSAVPSPADRATIAQGGTPASGSIDALFGNRAASTSEDSAASALAQAFGGTTETPAITGRPARAATGELSLDSVFRDGPQRPSRVSQSFSFDQFFTEGAAADSGAGAGTGTPSAGTPVQGEPAERSADDVQQFNSWLQGLKQQ